jgi:hypothetical protein
VPPAQEQVDFHRSAQLPSTVGDERPRNQPFDNTPQHYGASAAPLAPNLWGAASSPSCDVSDQTQAQAGAPVTNQPNAQEAQDHHNPS